MQIKLLLVSMKARQYNQCFRVLASSIEHGGTRPFSIITVPDGLPVHEGTRPFSILWLYRPSK